MAQRDGDRQEYDRQNGQRHALPQKSSQVHAGEQDDEGDPGTHDEPASVNRAASARVG